MPYKKRINRRRRRQQRKKKRAPNGFQAIAKIGKFIPPTMMVKLRYVEQISLDPGEGGVPTNYFFRMNSLYDPNYSGVGHQFYGYDQILELGYTKYIVLGSKINIKSIQPNYQQVVVSNAYNQNIISSTIKTNPTTTMTSTQELLENGESKYHFTNLTYMKSHNNYFSAKKFFGVTDVKDNADLGAEVTGNPSNVAYCRISAQPVDKNLNSYQASILVTIDALCYFHDRQTIVGS